MPSRGTLAGGGGGAREASDGWWRDGLGVETLKDFYPNFASADTCALARAAGTTPHDWYAVVEPSLSACIGATSGTCWRRGANPSRAEGGPGSGNGWDYQTWSSSNQFFYFGYMLYGAVIDTLQMDNRRVTWSYPNR